jgi:hypothetical protein
MFLKFSEKLSIRGFHMNVNTGEYYYIIDTIFSNRIQRFNNDLKYIVINKSMIINYKTEVCIHYKNLQWKLS